MSALTLTLIRLAFLAVLWLFVIAAVGVVRTDLFGSAGTSRRQARKAAKASKKSAPKKAAKKAAGKSSTRKAAKKTGGKKKMLRRR